MSSALEQTTPGTASAPAIARRVALLALLIIFTANLFNYMDRMLVSAMERQLREAFQLDQTEFGYLWSLFTIGYLVCATPIGFLADRFNRCWLFAICIVIWSAATLGTGLATAKWVLYVSRLFIGVGEAGCLIIGPALLSDYFAQARYGMALSIFYLGQPLGGTGGFILPPLIITALALDWPVTFYVAGVPGFALAALILLFPDPPRGGEEHVGHGHSTVRFADYLQLLKNRSLALIILAQTFSVIILVPLLHYGKEFLLARHGMDEGHATKIIGGIMVMGALGSVVSGFVGDRLARRFKGAYALLAGFGYLAGWGCFFTAFRTTDPTILAVALAAGGFCLFLCMPAVNTQIANVVHPLQRAAAWALAVFVLHLLGDTIFPPIFGHVSTALAANHAQAPDRVDTVDEDKDGKISRAEFTKFVEAQAQPGMQDRARERAERVFTRLDNNGDGTISKERWTKWADKRAEALGRRQAFEYFSFALALASLCCFIATGTARGDIQRFVGENRG